MRADTFEWAVVCFLGLNVFSTIIAMRRLVQIRDWLWGHREVSNQAREVAEFRTFAAAVERVTVGKPEG